MNSEIIVELELECSTICNAKCPLCYRNYKSFHSSPYAKPIIRPLGEVIEQLDTFKNLKYVMLVGSMSEPTLYPDFLQLVSYLKERNLKIEICTNGDTNDCSFWNSLGNILSDDDMVYFTICGSTQEIHETYRMGTNLDRIIRNAKSLREVRGIDYAQCIRFEYNTDDFDRPEFKKLVSQFSHVYMTETFFPKDISTYAEEFDINRFLPCHTKLQKYMELILHAERLIKMKMRRVSDCMCRRTNRFQMDVFGNIYPCYIFLEYMNGKPWEYNDEDLSFVNHDCCRFCDKMVQNYAKRNRLEYVI